MRETLTVVPAAPPVPDADKAAALHALGATYVKQGHARQGLALLLASRRFAEPTLALSRALAAAYLQTGEHAKALAILDALDPSITEREQRIGAAALRANALTALGRAEEGAEALRHEMQG